MRAELAGVVHVPGRPRRPRTNDGGASLKSSRFTKGLGEPSSRLRKNTLRLRSVEYVFVAKNT